MLRYLLSFCLLLSLPLLSPTGISQEAAAHPAAYPHRHQSLPTRSRRVKRKAASPYYLSLNVVGNLVAPTPSSDMSQVLEAGGGASLVFGRRINRYLAIEGSALVTFHRAGDIVSFNTGALAGFTIDARLFLSPRATRIQPYGLVGLGSYLLAREGLNDPLEGVGVQAGIGVDFQLNPMVSLGIKAVFRGAYLDNRFGDWSPFPAESAFISMVTTEAGLTIRL